MDTRCRYCNPELALSACRDGECFLVQAVQGEAADRLRDVGVREGVLVNMLRNKGDGIVRVAGARVCLRQEMARRILGTSIAE